MDNKGLISIENLFSLFLILVLACGMLFLAFSSISSTLNIEDTITHRMILDNVANEISQVNSNGIGYSKYIKLPSDNGYYEISVSKNKLTIEYGDKKGETLLPISNIDMQTKLVSGKSYLVSKTDDGIVIR